ncbi:MAG: hypothetical protein MZW92_21195 [Comamonadaceae bacterium]|nr:hypothetical protein [Comamonadaceae bacterium]
MSIAAELDHTVMLVDADVARPSRAAHAGPAARRRACSTCCERQGRRRRRAAADQRRQADAAAQRHAARRGPPSCWPATRWRALLDDMATRYPDRIIIFDSPPLLLTTESRVLATHMGQIVVVVQAGRTLQSAVQQALATIEACPVRMMVLNKAAHRRRRPTATATAMATATATAMATGDALRRASGGLSRPEPRCRGPESSCARPPVSRSHRSAAAGAASARACRSARWRRAAAARRGRHAQPALASAPTLRRATEDVHRQRRPDRAIGRRPTSITDGRARASGCSSGRGRTCRARSTIGSTPSLYARDSDRSDAASTTCAAASALELERSSSVFLDAAAAIVAADRSRPFGPQSAGTGSQQRQHHARSHTASCRPTSQRRRWRSRPTRRACATTGCDERLRRSDRRATTSVRTRAAGRARAHGALGWALDALRPSESTTTAAARHHDGAHRHAELRRLRPELQLSSRGRLRAQRRTLHRASRERYDLRGCGFDWQPNAAHAVSACRSKTATSAVAGSFSSQPPHAGVRCWSYTRLERRQRRPRGAPGASWHDLRPVLRPVRVDRARPGRCATSWCATSCAAHGLEPNAAAVGGFLTAGPSTVQRSQNARRWPARAGATRSRCRPSRPTSDAATSDTLGRRATSPTATACDQQGCAASPSRTG